MLLKNSARDSFQTWQESMFTCTTSRTSTEGGYRQQYKKACNAFSWLTTTSTQRYTHVQPAVRQSLAHACQTVVPIPFTITFARGESIHVTIISQQPPTSTKSLLPASAVCQSLPTTCVIPTLSQQSVTSLPVTSVRHSLSCSNHLLQPGRSLSPVLQAQLRHCLSLAYDPLSKIREELSAGEKLQLMTAFTSGNVELIGSTTWNIPVLRIACTCLFAHDIDTQCHNIYTKLNGSNESYPAKVLNYLLTSAGVQCFNNQPLLLQILLMYYPA